MIERKIIVTGCFSCPFREYIGSTEYINYFQCKKYSFVLDEETAQNDNKTHPNCMLPVNIKSKNIK